MNPAAQLREYRGHDGVLSVAALHEFFDRLEVIETAFMLGEWTGGVLPTGHPGERQLGALRWDGKRFRGVDDVEPIISRDEHGARVANPILGTASLRMVQYRGPATATMIYDKHPIFDHFRRIDDDTVLGVMDRKGDAAPLFFFLRRLA
ncbi:MAG: DUF4334 domain-containing protein [Myxococcales bacterium]|nr:DUF4334 domain-containing protein [Myxococcales bacterium]MCB9753090.1 DUF4334 domain-containing protein [Myxococcales bacterium]